MVLRLLLFSSFVYFLHLLLLRHINAFVLLFACVCVCIEFRHIFMTFCEMKIFKIVKVVVYVRRIYDMYSVFNVSIGRFISSHIALLMCVVLSVFDSNQRNSNSKRYSIFVCFFLLFVLFFFKLF